MIGRASIVSRAVPRRACDEATNAFRKECNMALRTDNKLRLGGVYFGKSKDPKSLVEYHLKHGFAAAYDPGVEDRVQMEEVHR
jgi:hypothetical protein